MPPITVSVHVKPYVKAYLLRNYAKDGIVRFERKTKLHQSFLNVLNKHYHPTSEYNKKTYPEKVEVAIRYNDLFQHGISLSISQQHHFNGIIEEKIKNQMFILISACRFQGMLRKEAVYYVQKMMGFNETTYPADSINMAYDRQKKELFNITKFNSVLKL
jgi:hypothetical protein